MKKVFCMLLATVILCLLFCGCGNDNYNNNDDDYDYDKGYGYTAPKQGESFSDYLKRQDPDLYNDIQDRWDSLS